MEKGEYETQSNYQKRKWFLDNYLKYDNKSNKTEGNRLSLIWSNMINLGFRYPEPVENKIHQFLKSVKKV